MVSTTRAVVCLSLCLIVCQVQGAYHTERMNSTIQKLLQHYRIPSRERFNKTRVFSRDPLAGKMETKSVFMGGVLETYEELIGHMLKQLPTPTPQTAGSNEPASAAVAGDHVRTQLKYILKKVQDLKEKSYHEQEKFLHELRALKDIQMDNLVVQNKALSEFLELYEDASKLNVTMRRRRRRRQARRIKTHPRA